MKIKISHLGFYSVYKAFDKDIKCIECFNNPENSMFEFVVKYGHRFVKKKYLYICSNCWGRGKTCNDLEKLLIKGVK